MQRQRGTVVQRGRVFRIKYRTAQGKQKWEGGFPSRAVARDHLNEVLREINRGTYLEPKNVKFAEFAEQWLGSRPSIRGSTLAGYRSIARQHLVPFLGSRRLSEIQLNAVQDLALHLSKKVSAKTLHNCVTLLRVMLVGRRGPSAIKQGYTRHDPTQGVELPSRQTRAIVPPTKEEVWKLIEAGRKVGHDGYSMVFLAAFTGLRRGEILALRYRDIDWFSEEICVQRAISKVSASGGVHKWAWAVGPTKNRKSRRIGASPAVLQLLAALKKREDPEAFVFPDPAGKFVDPDYFDASIFAPIAKRVKLNVRFHDLRHFFASMLIAQGESAKYVCDQLGHSSIQVTFDTYGHLFPQAKKEASRRLEKAMFAGRRAEKVLPVASTSKRSKKLQEEEPLN
jgi:integrase